MDAILLLAMLAQSPPESLEARGERIAAKVEEIRGAKFASAVKLREGSRKEGAALALENAKLVYGEDLGACERALKALGLVPSVLKLDLAITAFALQGIPAYQRKDEIALVDAGAGDDELVYRYATALAEQRFGLREAARRTGPSFDAQMALAAVRQGEGDMAKQLFWASRKLDEKLPEDHLDKLTSDVEKWEKETSRFASLMVPRFFVRGAGFAYRRGGIFVESVRSRGGMAAADGIYERLPASTEQVLHPEKYVQDERPVSIDPKSIDDFLVSKGYKRVWSTTLGELGTSIVAETHIKEDTSQVGPGWAGDLLLYYEDGGGRALSVWATVWDTENDAIEFQAAGFKLMRAIAAEEKSRNLALRRGTAVGAMFNLPASMQNEAFDALWKCSRRAGDKTDPYGKEP